MQELLSLSALVIARRLKALSKLKNVVEVHLDLADSSSVDQFSEELKFKSGSRCSHQQCWNYGYAICNQPFGAFSAYGTFVESAQERTEFPSGDLIFFRP